MKVILFMTLGLFSTVTLAGQGCHCQRSTYCNDGDLVSCHEERDEYTNVCIISVVKEHANECPQPHPIDPRGPSGDPGNG